MKEFAFERVNLEAVSSFAEADKADREFWWNASIEERLEYMEYLRRINYGDAATERLQRIYSTARAE
jgi:hypothetical protein